MSYIKIYNYILVAGQPKLTMLYLMTTIFPYKNRLNNSL